MSGLLERAARFLLAPAPPTDPFEPPPAAPADHDGSASGAHDPSSARSGTPRAAIAAALPAAPRVAVLGAVQDTRPLAASLALVLRATDRAPSGLVAVWGGGAPLVRGVATRATARLVARLSVRDLEAVARGRLAWLELPPDPAGASATLHAAAAVVDGPVITALAGPRPPALEPLIDDHDLAVVAADPGSALASAALGTLAGRRAPAVACRPVPRGLASALAMAGLLSPRLDLPLAEVRS